MKDWQIRVIQEYDELVLRLAKIRVFIKYNLQQVSTKVERILIDIQEESMSEYEMILAKRIELWRSACKITVVAI